MRVPFLKPLAVIALTAATANCASTPYSPSGSYQPYGGVVTRYPGERLPQRRFPTAPAVAAAPVQGPTWVDDLNAFTDSMNQLGNGFQNAADRTYAQRLGMESLGQSTIDTFRSANGSILGAQLAQYGQNLENELQRAERLRRQQEVEAAQRRAAEEARRQQQLQNQQRR